MAPGGDISFGGETACETEEGDRPDGPLPSLPVAHGGRRLRLDEPSSTPWGFR